MGQLWSNQDLADLGQLDKPRRGTIVRLEADGPERMIEHRFTFQPKAVKVIRNLQNEKAERTARTVDAAL
jgi:hypothetical protein